MSIKSFVIVLITFSLIGVIVRSQLVHPQIKNDAIALSKTLEISSEHRKLDSLRLSLNLYSEVHETNELRVEHLGSNSPRLDKNYHHKILENYEPRDDAYFPCPNPVEIDPCVCTSNEDGTILDMDCSGVTSDEDLARAFGTTMPFTTYRNLIISGVKSASFTTLDEFTFGIVSFMKVVITDTSLQIIGDGTFSASAESLNYLILSNNNISQFPFETLNTFTSLTELHLDDNSLTNFNNLESPSLAMIDLSNNFGLNIETTLISSLPNLTSLYIEECGLTQFPPDVLLHLPIIEVLNIDNNEITTLVERSIYTSESTWRLVSFSGNPISTVEQDFLSEMLTTGSINMSDANLIEIDEAAWRPYFQQLQDGSINLEGNPLRCGCDIAWLFNDATNFYTRLTPSTACSDGTLVYNLPPDAFTFHCL